jgi:hypothetical protein
MDVLVRVVIFFPAWTKCVWKLKKAAVANPEGTIAAIMSRRSSQGATDQDI